LTGERGSWIIHNTVYCPIFPASAKEVDRMADAGNFAWLSSGFGAGMVTIGAAYGIGRIAGAAMDGSARNPQAAGEVRTSMIIACALIEGIALFGEVVCILLALK
jgi:F-type H+-transporting ATPase subunit c